MKLFGIYYKNNLTNLEQNHKNFCKSNNIEYNKVYIQEKIYSKYTFILEQLQRNLGETLLFIDSYCFFNSNKILIDLSKRSVWFQKSEPHTFDNFMVIHSNVESIKLFSDLSFEINKQLFGKRDDNSIRANLPDKYCIDLNYEEHGQNYSTLVRLCNSYEDTKNTLVMNTNSVFQEEKGNYFAEALCASKKYKSPNKTLKELEVFNPNKTKAIVTIYTKQIENYAEVSVESMKKFCLKNNHTLYIYREVPNHIKHMLGSWVKPFLLLNHYAQHDFIAWLDSDTLIGNNFTNIFENDISVFRDPSSWFFNSGFIVFKTNDKNHQLLTQVVQKIEKLDDLSGVYKHGGDQTIFNDVVKEFYPTLIPYSSNIANSHPVYPTEIDPTNDSNKLIHFMGLKNYFRGEVMKGYSVLMRKGK